MMTKTCVTYQSEKLDINRNQFWQAAWIWHQKPHIVNRRLFGIKTLSCFEAPISVNVEDHIQKLNEFCYDDLKSTSFTTDFIERMCSLKLKICSEDDILKISDKSFFALRKLLNKNRNYCETIEISVINYSKDEILYLQIPRKQTDEVVTPAVSFIMQYNDNSINIRVIENCVKTCIDWLQFLLIPKLIKWAKEASSLDFFESNGTSSLSCIDSDQYNELYIRLKDKYGKEIVEKWPENTDPSKFVYEDIAIAAYLCLLWNEEKVTFVDLGCGNGLLVHILSCEGYSGFGIDIRSRKIWSVYTPPSDLRVGTVTPAENSYFPEVDWIIGNHSDELTPWIPVFALRNSYKCKFFLLPCCAYEFSGQKYQRQNSSVSVYNDYIDYVKTICCDLGFEIKTDRLRIPSTKRICIIGHDKNYEDSDHERMKNEKVDAIMQLYANTSENQFKPREKIERVRNCTQIDRSVTSKIVDAISKTLIRNQLQHVEQNSNFDVWSTEYSITFKDAVSLLENEDLKKLKSECGGLQTLLRNHHSIFLICGGRIYFRKPTEITKTCDKWKKRPCWFFQNHPHSCPLEENKCSFIH